PVWMSMALRILSGFSPAGRCCDPPRYSLPACPFARIAFRIDAALFERLHIVQAGGRIVGRREPVRGAILRGTNLRARGCGLLVRVLHGPPISPDPAGPRQIPDERFGEKQLAVSPVEDV